MKVTEQSKSLILILMSKIRVSFILATKNRAKHLKKTLENIREFITKQDELIIMDGGSSDATKSLIMKNKDIVTYFESEKDFGEAHALNKAILHSKGKYIKVLSDDDYIYPEAMKKVISIMEVNPDIDALQCGGESYIYDEKTKKEKILFYEQVFPNVEIAKDLLHVITYCPCGLGLILTRRIVSKVGLFDTSFRAADLSYISKLVQYRTNFKYLNINLYKHINYAHSGENYIDEIHYDEGRVYLTHQMWEKLMSVDTKILSKIFGLDHIEKGVEIVRSIKLLDFLRRKKIYFPILFLDLIAKQRNIPSIVKKRFFSSKIQKSNPPIPPIRDNKLW